MKVAYQGVRGVYSEVAIRQFYGDRAEVINCDAFEDVFGVSGDESEPTILDDLLDNTLWHLNHSSRT